MRNWRFLIPAISLFKMGLSPTFKEAQSGLNAKWYSWIVINVEGRSIIDCVSGLGILQRHVSTNATERWRCIAQCRGDDKRAIGFFSQTAKTEHPRHIRLTTCRFDWSKLFRWQVRTRSRYWTVSSRQIFWNPSQTSSQSWHALFASTMAFGRNHLDLILNFLCSVVDISFTSCLLGALLILKNITSHLPWKPSRTSTWRCWTGTLNSTGSSPPNKLVVCWIMPML